MNTVFLLTGSNLSDSPGMLKYARMETESRAGVIVKSSHIYISPPWGYQSMNQFYNQCLEVRTGLNPMSLLRCLLDIEMKAGRTRTGGGYGDRILDIDILFYSDMVVETSELVIPHPRMHLRKFALTAMNEIAPDYLHPVLGQEIRILLQDCRDQSKVELFKKC